MQPKYEGVLIHYLFNLTNRRAVSIKKTCEFYSQALDHDPYIVSRISRLKSRDWLQVLLVIFS